LRRVATVVAAVAAGLEGGIGSCVGIHLASLNISEIRLTLARRRTIYAVFFKKMRVFRRNAAGSA